MCATMNWVSCSGMSTGVAAMKMPDSPPIVNIDTKPIAFSIGTWKRRLPRHTVRSEEHTSELQSRLHLVCRLLLEKKKFKPCEMGFCAHLIRTLSLATHQS